MIQVEFRCSISYEGCEGRVRDEKEKAVRDEKEREVKIECCSTVKAELGVLFSFYCHFTVIQDSS